MRILQINCVYNSSSTGKIVYDIHTELQKRGIESVVCYGRGDKINAPNIYKTCGELYSKINNAWSRITGLMYGGCFFSTNKLILIIKKEKPDVVHLHCINGYFVNIYRLVTYLRDAKIKTVLTLHAEFMHTGNCGHALECEKWKTGCGHCPRLRKETKSIFFDRTHVSWNKMKYAFNGFENLTIVSVSPWLMERAKSSPILSDKNHTVVLNGINANIFHPHNTSELCKKHNLTNGKIIFHATAGFTNNPNHIKGGYYVLKLAEMLKEENVKIFVAGTYDTSIEAPENIIFLGRINDQRKLAQYYSMADITLLTSKKETFSMITAESLCCGTPVVGFKAGAPEQISLTEYSEFVEHGDVETLLSCIKKWIYEIKTDKMTVSKKAKENYSKEKMCEEYIQLYEFK